MSGTYKYGSAKCRFCRLIVKMKNIQADTSMRENIAKPIGGATSKPLSD
ncbi:hypothetical protein M080_1133 [Bacteroides fragilis str. 3397 T10]|nr:hypothetical protein M080_1133 [Bacteroides fragilis str. 3397 T10]EXZ54829.1 hypothetical protein M108_1170 [Bacteroides fragilis str. 3397 T14]